MALTIQSCQCQMIHPHFQKVKSRPSKPRTEKEIIVINEAVSNYDITYGSIFHFEVVTLCKE